MAPTDIDFGLKPSDPSTYLTTIWRLAIYAVGAGTVAEQIVACMVIIVASSFLGAVTWGTGLLIALFILPFLAIGLLRIIPQVNALWPLGP